MPGRTVTAAPGFTIAIVISAAGLLIAGCSSNNNVSAGAGRTPAPVGVNSQAPPPSTPSAPPSTAGSSASPAQASGPARCHTSQLAGRVRSLGAAAGNRYAALVLTNTSDVECKTYGYVGLQLTRSGGSDLPTRVIREPKPAPHRVVLEPGESAFTRILWTVVPGEGESSTRQCAPTPSRLLVIPPDERTQTAATWPGGPVCQRGRISVTALSAGTGGG